MATVRMINENRGLKAQVTQLTLQNQQHAQQIQTHQQHTDELKKQHQAELDNLKQAHAHALENFLNEELSKHVANKDIAKSHAALTLGANLLYSYGNQRSPLELILAHEDEDFLDQLLNSGIDLQKRGPQGNTVLQTAARGNNLKALRLILMSYPKDDSELKEYVIACNEAASREAKTLIAECIMAQAAKWGNLDLIKKSMELGANANSNNLDGMPIKQIAKYFKNDAVVEFLSQKSPLQTGSLFASNNNNNDESAVYRELMARVNAALTENKVDEARELMRDFDSKTTYRK